MRTLPDSKTVNGSSAGRVQKLAAEFRKMRLRTRISICTRVGIAIVMVIAGLVQIADTLTQPAITGF